MLAIKPTDLISVEDYLTGELNSDIKHELIDGYVYAISRSQAPLGNAYPQALLDVNH
jgi:hypothetical protein